MSVSATELLLVTRPGTELPLAEITCILIQDQDIIKQITRMVNAEKSLMNYTVNFGAFLIFDRQKNL